MTKTQAQEILEKNDIIVISSRMFKGTPKVKIYWDDYPKARNLAAVVNGEIDLALTAWNKKRPQ